MNLLRVVYENWVAFHYLSNCPNKAYLWLANDKQPPDHKDMLKKVHKDLPKKEMMDLYHILCRFAHTDAVAVLPQISSGLVPNEITIHYGTTFKNDLFMASSYQITELIGHMLCAISHWIPNMDGWHNKFNNISNQILSFIEQENKKMQAKKNNSQIAACQEH